MFKNTIVALAFIAAGTEINAGEFIAGTAECKREDASSDCSIQWDFAQAPRAYVQVEYLDENSSQWQPSGQPYGPVHTRSKPLPPAKLYRVRGCDDPAVQRNCVSSTVHWAVARPPVEEIPDYLVDGNGVEMHIVKNAPEAVQIAQYNVYRLIQLLDRIPDLSELPPMTKPRTVGTPLGDPGGEEQVLTGIYENYTERRRQSLNGNRRGD